MKIRPPEIKDAKIAVIGLGYVGLPLAITFGRLHPTIGFDIDAASRNLDVTENAWNISIRNSDRIKYPFGL